MNSVDESVDSVDSGRQRKATHRQTAQPPFPPLCLCCHLPAELHSINQIQSSTANQTHQQLPDTSMRYRLSKMNESLGTLERRMDFVETQLSTVFQEPQERQDEPEPEAGPSGSGGGPPPDMPPPPPPGSDGAPPSDLPPPPPGGGGAGGPPSDLPPPPPPGAGGGAPPAGLPPPPPP